MNSPVKVDSSSFLKMLDLENKTEQLRLEQGQVTSLSLLVENADVLGPMVFIQRISISQVILRGHAAYARFRVGDSVDIREKDPRADRSLDNSKDWTIQKVFFPEPGIVEVVLNNNLLVELKNGVEYFLFESSNQKFRNILMRRLNQVAHSGGDLLGSEYFNLQTASANFVKLFESLNTMQKGAIEYLISNNLNGAIQGPPGTGKTQLLLAVVSLAIQSGMTVGITSFTNNAVDNLLGRISNSNVSDDWVRVGTTNRINRELYSKDLDLSLHLAESISIEDGQTSIIGTTLHKLAYANSSPKYDVLIVDECGQVPLYFFPFIKKMAKRIVLVGDQFQLPPVLSTKHDYLPADNLFSYFINEDTPMLETQYRMRKEIQEWSSEKFYKSKLVPHASVVNRDYFENSYAFFMDSIVSSESFGSSIKAKTSKQEAEFISDKIKMLIKGESNLDSVGVICPYRVQAGMVNSILQQRFGTEKASKILVDTVERFQGQEKEAIFLSFGSSLGTNEDVRFLANLKRLNVSITRAKSRFFCLYDKSFIKNSNSNSNSESGEDLIEFLKWTSGEKVKIRRAA